MLRNCLALLSLVLVPLVAAADEKTSEPEQPKVRTLSIDPETFGEYPAVLVSLQEGKLYKTDKNGDPSRDVMATMDLFIEPRDPEISSYRGKGKRTELGFLDVDFDPIERLPQGIDWSTGLPINRSVLKAGFVFFVRTVSGAEYKVRIDALDPMAQTIKLSYARLLPAARAATATIQEQRVPDANARLKEPSTDKSSPSAAAQAVALRAVNEFFIEVDPERATKHLAPDATYRRNRPENLIDYIKKQQQAGVPFPSIREIGFFTKQDMPKIEERLGAYKGATKMFDKDRVPAHLKDGLGCFIVTYPLKAGQPEVSAVIVMIFQKIGDEHKIVYIDDN